MSHTPLYDAFVCVAVCVCVSVCVCVWMYYQDIVVLI